MTVHRFFVPPESIQQNSVTLTGPVVHQMYHVLRLRAGERVVLLDNSGWEHQTEITRISDDIMEGVVFRRQVPNTEPRTKVTLYQAVLKGDRFEFVLQKGTELGVVEFVPIITSRCIVADLNSVYGKFNRWQRIILEAAEQCGRAKMPLLRPAVMFLTACEQARGTGLSLMPWEEEKTFTLRWLLRPQGGERPFNVNLFIGPEGGFSPEEVALAQEYGIRPVSLGPRILRAETAGIVAAAVVLYELGDLGK